MGRGDDDTVFCNVQMPLGQGRELLSLVTELSESGSHPNLELVFQHMLLELKMSIDIVENPPSWGASEPTKH
ncbi:hypothetical protein [Pseudomonas umsongensis]